MLVWGVYTLETVQTILISRDAFALYAYVMPVTLTKYAVPVLGGIGIALLCSGKLETSTE